MNSNNVEITDGRRVDYKEMLYNKQEIPDMQTKQIIDKTCILIHNLIQISKSNILLQIENFNTHIWWELNLCISEIKYRKGVELEDLDKLSVCVKDMKSSSYNHGACFIEYLDQFIADKRAAVSNEGFEYVEDHYGDCSANKLQTTIQNETPISLNDYDLEEFDVIETSTGAVGGLADTDDGFVLL